MEQDSELQTIPAHAVRVTPLDSADPRIRSAYLVLDELH